jgi:hypothetical protein
MDGCLTDVEAKAGLVCTERLNCGWCLQCYTIVAVPRLFRNTV